MLKNKKKLFLVSYLPKQINNYLNLVWKPCQKLGISSWQDFHLDTLVDLLWLVERIEIFAPWNKLKSENKACALYILRSVSCVCYSMDLWGFGRAMFEFISTIAFRGYVRKYILKTVLAVNRRLKILNLLHSWPTYSLWLIHQFLILQYIIIIIISFIHKKN